MLVRKELYLDVSGIYNELLDIYIIVCKELFSLLLCGGHCRFKLFGLFDKSYASSAAACARLYHYRIADLCGNLLSLLKRPNNTVGAGNYGNVVFYHRLLCVCLITHSVHSVSARTYELYSALVAKTYKVAVFGKKTEAGVNCLCARYLAGGKQCL